ncbi:MAG TPA: TIGR04282 family arsenosugar biosynthesis glycosyltransferase [Roseiflexaceae bacterium]|nr:TIGR04282 family arsenosugar biosynthesis glycosyltransferase [Roseiflexaceae bacterium]
MIAAPAIDALRRVLLVVAKQPAAGQTKTRLCPPLAAETAAALYECFLRDTLDVMRRAPGVARGIVYLPDDAAGYFHALAPDMALTPQRGADLGERLDQLLSDALVGGAAQAVVMDSDSPTLPAAYVAEAFARLDGPDDVVLGPCDDGGYYLIGLKRPQPQLLREVQMSTPFVVRDTLALADSLGLKVALLPPWYDVDTAAELERLRAELAGADQHTAPHTRALLAEIGANGWMSP